MTRRGEPGEHLVSAEELRAELNVREVALQRAANRTVIVLRAAAQYVRKCTDAEKCAQYLERLADVAENEERIRRGE